MTPVSSTCISCLSLELDCAARNSQGLNNFTGTDYKTFKNEITSILRVIKACAI